MRIGTPENGEGTVVGANVRLQGTLKDTQDITVHGTVEGNVVSSKSVFITESATVKGPVIGETVTIGGTVKGSIEAKVKLEILPSGKVSGSIAAATLIINAGAQFNGKCGMQVDSKETHTKSEEKTDVSGSKFDTSKEIAEPIAPIEKEKTDFELE
ncbi:polymer-forming cytoskeletal protein [Candidatus Berkelbacteria bacterium]|nr:polymer-forming cytoskeletal protein [Candidatus Berkelbacteria bacterium]OIP06704.1 MAG: hypothetical protein AUK41_01860 [Candidatus Berkelbacteria bacterium CG2_30_43_20]PIU86921.1 MAG: hypothetical protein COS66_03530 [Candidatus Berkelbacteria bacterium CG06_land_8_20_14_3_00_43_10]